MVVRRQAELNKLFDEISIGDTFTVGNDLVYVKTETFETIQQMELNAMILQTAEMVFFDCYEKVIPIAVEVVEL